MTIEGVKDMLVGGVKETVGHLFGKPDLESEGRQQIRKAQAELKHQAFLPNLTAAQIFQLRRQYDILFSDIRRSGGYGFMCSTGRLRHIDTRHEQRADVRYLFAQKGERWHRFHLKRWNNAALLNDIRTRNTKRPLRPVTPSVKGLMYSNMLTGTNWLGKKEFEFKKDTNRWTNLWSDIRLGSSGGRVLRHVDSYKIRDRSQPRLSLLWRTYSAKNQFDRVLGQITEPDLFKRTLRNHVHIPPDDHKIREWFVADTKSTHVKGLCQRAELLDEVKQGSAHLKHVACIDDKSKPAISDTLHTWNKQGFLAEVRQGTELRSH